MPRVGATDAKHLYRVDIGADERLAQDGEQAALGLLADRGADVDELGVVQGSDGSCHTVSPDSNPIDHRR